MKNNKAFLFVVLSTLAVTSLMGCANNNSRFVPAEDDEEEEKVYEIGDTVREWDSDEDYAKLPLDVPEGGIGVREIDKDLGYEDYQSLHYKVKCADGYITSEVEEQFFKENDAKNGDIVSLFVYIPNNNNLQSLELEVQSTGSSSSWGASADVITGTKVEVTTEKQEKWLRLETTYDTLYTLGSIRVNFVPVDEDKEVEFYVDLINITYGAETVETDYVSNEESLWKTYEEYFKVGCCMSSDMIRNTKMRQIVKEQFNSVTAENEGKPEQILDQEACQALSDNSEVAITMKPFEKIYSWCEANHIKVRHHTFVWYSQTPGWFFTEDYTANGKQASRDLMLKRMENFIKVTIESINERWPGLVYAIDVANEATHQQGIRTDNNKWYDTVGDKGDGDNFVYYACKYASMYKEEYQELYYNDYEFDYNTPVCEYVLNTLLKKAIAEGLVDGVGIQGHIDCDNIRHDIANAQLIKEKDLKCQITELDITTNSSEEGYAKQKDAYKDMVGQILQLNKEGKTDVNAIIVWGITDDTSWKRGQDPLLFTSSYKKKPAYYGFLEALEAFEKGEYTNNTTSQAND